MATTAMMIEEESRHQCYITGRTRAQRRGNFGRGRAYVIDVRRFLFNTLVVVAALGYAGCTHADPKDWTFTREEWEEEVTHRQIDSDDVVYPFDSSSEMEAWLDDVLNFYGNEPAVTKLDRIQRAMFDKGFDFEYEDGLTLTAAEAFEQRRGNCMSFTALFVTLARSAGVETFLLSVRRAPEVVREDDLVIVNHHVVAAHRSPQQLDVYDFYLSKEEPMFQRRVVDDVMATAMYHNNMGGLAIRNENLAAAEWNLLIATTLAPSWPPGWVNLGVLRFRRGDVEGALDAYQHALEAEPNQPSALTNMAYVYREMGRQEESEAALRAAANRSSSPFTLIALADADMFQGKYEDAARYLRRARRRYRSEPEVWESMARLARYQGDLEKANKHLAKAEKLKEKKSRSDDTDSSWMYSNTNTMLPPR